MIADDYSLVRLFDGSVQTITDHICSLDDSDRYLRFGYPVTDSSIADYVKKSLIGVNTRESASFWFGITSGSDLVATLHVAIGDNVAEFAFTTLGSHRGKKLGQLLFARGYQLVTEFKIDRIYLACLSQNMAMRAIAKKFGLAVMTHGTDSEGSVNIQYPVSLKQLETVKRVIIDKNIFTHD